MTFFFASDLHGSTSRYRALIAAIEKERPDAVLLGGDLLPSGAIRFSSAPHLHRDFINDYLVPTFGDLRKSLGNVYPRILLILGNDDCRIEEAAILDGAAAGHWEYIHDRHVAVGKYTVYGYQYVPPTPFLLKDWERYDVSRYVDPGCVSPEEGFRSVPVEPSEVRYATIEEDLARLSEGADFDNAIFMLHSPPHETKLDRCALEGKTIDHVPLDPHVGSIAIRRFIETRQPLLTLHGHVHESARITGGWMDRLGRTTMISAAHDGPELALVRFDPADPAAATRELI